jgi:hypothetical protein
VSWAWEYEPGEDFVIGGEQPAPPALVAEVEKKAEELVRAAEATYLDGSAHQGNSEGARTVTVMDGFFLYLVVPRHERVYILQVTAY